MPQARLPSKPTAELAYTIHLTPGKATAQSRPPPPRLVIFLNNLLLPASSWEPAIAQLTQHRQLLHQPACPAARAYRIPVLTYDRFGQGATTDRDPLDARAGAEPGYGHDFADVVADLRALITLLVPQLFPSAHYSPPPRDPDAVALLLVGASIGAPLARLYAATYPRSVAGLILLDSNLANTDYSALWPDPAAPDFDPAAVTAPDCSLEQYVDATRKLAGMFDLRVKNAEGLDRRSSSALLPFADRPRLYAPGNGDALAKVMVVAHDADAFADEGARTLGTPRSFTRRWVQAAWDRYNCGLLEVGDSGAFGGVRVAKGCGHFIQRDDPAFVAGAVGEMLDVLGW